MQGRCVAGLAAVLVVAAIILAGVGIAEGKPTRGIARIPPQPIRPMLVEISDLLATPHAPTVDDVQLEWSEIPNATSYNIYRSASVRGDGFNFSSPHAVIPATGSGKIVWADAGAYADTNDHAWVVTPVFGATEYFNVSNIAWKKCITLRWGTGVAGASLNYISLPYRMNITSNSAGNLLADMRWYGSPANSVTSISRWNSNTSLWQSKTPIGGENFALKPGEAYMVRINQLAVAYKIVGAYDPDFTHWLFKGTGPYAGDHNYISLPYHFDMISGSYRNNAAALLGDLKTDASLPIGVSSVARWDQDLSLWQSRVAIAGTNFQLFPGEGYRVTMYDDYLTWKCPVVGLGA